MTLATEIGLSLGDFVLAGDQPPPQKGDRALPAPQFVAHFYCGQTAGCIKIPLGMEVGLSPGNFVRWGPTTPPQKGGAAPNFRPMPVAAKRSVSTTGKPFLPFYSAPQCSHCKRCTSYGNSVRLSVRLSVRPSVCHTPVLCQNDGT